MCAFHATLPATVQDRKNKSIGGCFALCLSAAAQASRQHGSAHANPPDAAANPAEPCRRSRQNRLAIATGWISGQDSFRPARHTDRVGSIALTLAHGDRGETGFGSQSGCANCRASSTEKALPNIISADGGWPCGRDRHASLLLNSHIVRDAVAVPPPGIAALAQSRILDGA
jgi:hypothetical protein